MNEAELTKTARDLCEFLAIFKGWTLEEIDARKKELGWE